MPQMRLAISYTLHTERLHTGQNSTCASIHTKHHLLRHTQGYNFPASWLANLNPQHACNLFYTVLEHASSAYKLDIALEDGPNATSKLASNFDVFLCAQQKQQDLTFANQYILLEGKYTK